MTQRNKPSKTGNCPTENHSKENSQVSTRASGHRHRPSERLNPRSIDPFNDNKRSQSTFSTIYNNGGVPCRLQHGSVKHCIQWDVPIANLPFDPVLITLAEGLRETKHPYNFIAYHGFEEMLHVPNAAQSIIPILPKLVQPLRLALSSQDQAVFSNTLQILVGLSSTVGKELCPHLKCLMSMISRKMMAKNSKEKVICALQEIESNCGEECLAVIKLKVPTYQSVLK